MSGGEFFDERRFVEEKIAEIKSIIGNDRAIIACSGGVDSTTSAVLTHRALGNRLMCVFIDTAFMRLGEPESVVKRLKSPPYSLPVRLVDARKRFLDAMRGLRDAEEKRKAFRETFYTVLSGVAKEEECRFLVQGTILADVIETTKGVKTQHDVLEQVKIDPKKVYGFRVVEPLVSLYKHQVRAAARFLKLTLETSERQPFPGPGLSVRVVGEINAEKVDVEKRATQVVEKKLGRLGASQYFAATFDNVKARYLRSSKVKEALMKLLAKEAAGVEVRSIKDRATGLKRGRRLYGRLVLVGATDDRRRHVELSMGMFDKVWRGVVGIDPDVTRVLYRLTDGEMEGRWLIVVRAVETKDFMTAKVFDVPWKVLNEVNASIMEGCESVSAVYYDVTPKPPATIEFE